MGQTVELDGGGSLDAEISFRSHYPIGRVELVVNGSVAYGQEWPEGRREGLLRHQLQVDRAGWLAARLWGNSRDSFDQPLYAHGSPIRFRCGQPSAQRAAAAHFFLDRIDHSLQWIDKVGRYNNDQQREEVRDLFRRGREVYAELTG